MPKPITDWGEDELRAVFGGLPDGTIVAVKGDYLVAANVSEITIHRDAKEGNLVWPVHRGDLLESIETALTATLTGRGDENTKMVTLRPSTEAAADLRLLKYADNHKGKEVKAALKRLLARGYRLRYA